MIMILHLSISWHQMAAIIPGSHVSRSCPFVLRNGDSFPEQLSVDRR